MCCVMCCVMRPYIQILLHDEILFQLLQTIFQKFQPFCPHTIIRRVK